MAGLNKVICIGNLGADPEMRYTANGAAVVTFNVAANEAWNDKDGEKHERTEWFSVVCWNRLAETCAQYLSKGSQVYVEGRQQTRSWEQDGQKRYKTELVAETVRFLSSRDRNAEPAPPRAREEIEPDDLPF